MELYLKTQMTLELSDVKRALEAAEKEASTNNLLGIISFLDGFSNITWIVEQCVQVLPVSSLGMANLWIF